MTRIALHPSGIACARCGRPCADQRAHPRHDHRGGCDVDLGQVARRARPQARAARQCRRSRSRRPCTSTRSRTATSSARRPSRAQRHGGRHRSALPRRRPRNAGPERVGPRAQLEDDQRHRAGQGRRHRQITSSRCSMPGGTQKVVVPDGIPIVRTVPGDARRPQAGRIRVRVGAGRRRRRAYRAAHPGQQGRRAAAAMRRGRSRRTDARRAVRDGAGALAAARSSASTCTCSPTTTSARDAGRHAAHRGGQGRTIALLASSAAIGRRARPRRHRRTTTGWLTPMTIMVLAIRLYDVGLRDDAVFWFYAAKNRFATARRASPT